MMASPSSSQDETSDILSSISMDDDHSHTILTPPSTSPPPPQPTSPSPDQVLSSFPLQDNTKTIYVTHLGPDVEPNYIRDLFRPYGLIKGLRVIWERDVDTIAFIEFEEQESAKKAMSEIDQIIGKNFQDRCGNENATATMTVIRGDARDIGGEAENARGDVNDNDDSYGNGGTKGKPEEAEGFTVFVGNATNLTDKDLMEAFKPYGRITRGYMVPKQSFGFVTYADKSSAGDALRKMDGALVKNMILRVEWEYGTMMTKMERERERHKHEGNDFTRFEERSSATVTRDVGGEEEFTVFVGRTDNLTEADLFEAFEPFGRIKRLFLKRDESTGRSLGFAYVSYANESSALQAIKEMNGARVKNAIIRVDSDEGRKSKKKISTKVEKAPEVWREHQTEYDKISRHTSPDNTTVFVGNTNDLTKKDIIKAFQPFGRLVRVFMMPGQNFGFVTYAHESSAGDAVRRMDGARVKNTTLFVQWEYGRKAELEANTKSKKEELELERRKEYDNNERKAETKTIVEKVEELEMDRQSQKEFYYDKISKQSSPENTTIFCCYKQGLLTDQILRQRFSPFGKITGVKCYKDEGYGYVRFQERSSAIRAIFEKNGVKTSKGGVVRVGWGQPQYIN